MDAKRAAQLSDEARAASDIVSRRQAESAAAMREASRHEGIAAAAAAIPGILEDVERAARSGNRVIDVPVGGSCGRDHTMIAYSHAIQAHMVSKGYKAEWIEQEPSNEGEIGNSYYWRFSW